MPTLQRTDDVFVLDLGDDENRFSREWMTTVTEALDEVDGAEGPRALVTVGTGGRHRPAGADRAVVGDHEHDAVDDLARGTHRPGRDRETGQGEELLGAAEPATRSPGHHDGPHGPRSAQGSASLRRTSAVSSSTPRAKVSSDTRI